MVYAGLLGSLLGLLGIELGIMWVLWVRIKFVTVELVSEFSYRSARGGQMFAMVMFEGKCPR